MSNKQYAENEVFSNEPLLPFASLLAQILLIRQFSL